MKALRLWHFLEEIVLGWTLLGLALLAFVQVVLRYAFSTGFDWVEEFGRYVGIFLTFLGASVGVKHGTHFSVEALVKALPPRASSAVRAFASLFTAALFAVVMWYGWTHASRLHGFGVTSASLRIPMWIPYAPIPVLSATLALRFLLQAVQHARRAVHGVPGQSPGA
ncbi:MAG: TRAP transporter small permease [Deferrisomatales bacterium]|nr:TRAP transporter small permease [Deferrisomatales bacterium]